MKRGDTVWVPHPGLGGGPMHAREWRVEYVGTDHVGADRVGLVYGFSCSSCALEDAYPSREACEAAIALRAASEAVAKAREAVVEAARGAAGRWGSTPWVPYDEGDSGDITDAVRRLEEAERVEAEARARLEALR